MILNAFWGFFFGTVGIYVLMLFSYTEFVAWPGQFAASFIVNPDAEGAEKTFVLFFCGVFYAFLFMLLGALFGKPRAT
jgi:hypothetical protein